MTYDEACEYTSRACEAEGEQRGEYGAGCVSLGYSASEWAPAYDGYRTADDPEYARAERIIREYRAANPGPPTVFVSFTGDGDVEIDIPF